MCVIAIYKNGKKPVLDEIELMMDANKDGAGVAYNNGKCVVFKKGFTTAKAVMRFVNSIPETAINIIFHARIATSGGISAQKCHPFIVSKNSAELNQTQGAIKGAVLFHNGVFDITPEKGFNDTQTVIKNGVFPLFHKDKNGFINGNYDNLLELAFNGNRVAIMTPQKTMIYGDWKKIDEYPNAIFSNTHFNYRRNFYNDYSPAWNWNAIPKIQAKGVYVYENGNSYTLYRAQGKNGIEARLKNKDGICYINGLEIPRRWYEKDYIPYRERCERYAELCAENGTPPTLSECITKNGVKYPWNGKETPLEYIRRIEALLSKTAYTPLKTPLCDYNDFNIENPNVALLTAVKKLPNENTSDYIQRLKANAKESCFRGCEIYSPYMQLRIVNNFPVLWNGKETSAEYSARVQSLIKTYTPSYSYENLNGRVYEV